MNSTDLWREDPKQLFTRVNVPKFTVFLTSLTYPELPLLITIKIISVQLRAMTNYSDVKMGSLLNGSIS